MKRWMLAAATVFLTSCAPPVNAKTPTSPITPATTYDVQHVNVVDGDTFDLDQQRIRIIGINAPEKDECGATQAAQALTTLLNSGPIELATDISETDQYGRLLRYIEINQRDVGLELIQSGWAIARRYPPDTARHDLYTDAQTAAQTAHKGFWDPTLCDPNPPTGTDLELTLNPNPPGDDTLNLNDETIIVTNHAPQPVDITGWILADESSSHRYTFPHQTLNPNQSVTVHSGCGTPTTTDQYWCATTGIWNNTGDTAYLKTAAGSIITTRTYTK